MKSKVSHIETENLSKKGDTIFKSDVIVDSLNQSMYTTVTQPYYVLLNDTLHSREWVYNVGDSPDNRHIKFLSYAIDNDLFTYLFYIHRKVIWGAPSKIITINRQGLPYEIKYLVEGEIVNEFRLKNKCNDFEIGIINSQITF